MASDSEPIRFVTLDLIRKRSEHNQSLVSNLEEIALHQEELQAIGPVLPRACGSSLRILLLQNNVISRLDPKEMKFFKQLEYLNIALNNIQVVEGLGHLEFLKKIDLTLNFISIDRLEESVQCLSQLRSLRELFLIGNPCMNKEKGGFDREKGRMYVIAKLPLLEFLDGEIITRSQRLRAKQMIVALEQELKSLVSKHEASEIAVNYNYQQGQCEGSNHCTDEKEVTTHCPEDRLRMSHESAKKRAEKEEKERENQPKFKSEKDLEHDQQQAIEKTRMQEENGDIRQCNEGRWEFWFDEDRHSGMLTLGIRVQKHLSSSLIDVDVHPTYVSVVIKSKVLRVKLPTEVKAGECTAQRITTTGQLLITMPMCDGITSTSLLLPNRGAVVSQQTCSRNKKSTKRRNGLQQELLRDAVPYATAPLQRHGLIPEAKNEQNEHPQAQNSPALDMVECSTQYKHNRNNTSNGIGDSIIYDNNNHHEDDNEEECPPPLI